MSYESDKVKRQIDSAISDLDQVATHLQGIESRLNAVQEKIFDIGLSSDLKVASGYMMTTVLSEGIDTHLRGVFGLRNALNDFKEFL